MKRSSFIALVTSLAFVASACGAFGVHAQTLSLAYKAGDVYKYGLHATTKVGIGVSGMTVPVGLDVTAKETVTVNSVDTSHDADVSVAVSDVTIKSSANGMTNTTTGTPGTTVEMTIGPDGRILSVNGQALSGTMLGPLAGNSGSFISAVLPGYAVKPGDTWSKTYDITNPAGTGSVHIVAHSKYVRDETLKDVKAAVVETRSTTTFNLTIDIAKLIGGMTFPSISGGMMQRTTGDSASAPAAAPRTITVTGSSTSDATTWVDPGGHRVIKTHETGTGVASVTVQMPAGVEPPAGTVTTPMLSGPIAINASQTLDLTPA